MSFEFNSWFEINLIEIPLATDSEFTVKPSFTPFKHTQTHTKEIISTQVGCCWYINRKLIHDPPITITLFYWLPNNDTI